MKKKTPLILTTVFIVVFFSGVGYASWKILNTKKFFQNHTIPKKNYFTTTQLTGNTYTESGQRFSIQVPAGWFVKDYGSINPKVTKFIALDSESLPDILPLSPSFPIIITVQAFTFDELLSIMQKNLEGIEKKERIINGKRAIEIIYDSDMGNGKIFGIVFPTVGGTVTVTGEDNTETRGIIETLQIIK